MYCDKCQNIVNLDILLSTHDRYGPNNRKYRPYPHHENYAAFEIAAAAGCDICKLVWSASTSKIFASRYPSTPIYFRFTILDLLKFDAIDNEAKTKLGSQPEVRIIRFSAIEGSVY
jgi:hypothetical protein